MKFCEKLARRGSTRLKTRFFCVFFDFQRPGAQKRHKNEEKSVQTIGETIGRFHDHPRRVIRGRRLAA